MQSKLTELHDRLQMYQKINESLNQEVQALRKQLEQEREGKEVVSKADYQSIMDSLKQEVLSKKRFEDLYDRARKQLEECRSQDAQKEINELKMQLQELKQKLSRPHLQMSRRIAVSDEDIIKLRKSGKTVKSIADQTGISTSTINRILKENNVRVLKVYNDDDDTN